MAEELKSRRGQARKNSDQILNTEIVEIQSAVDKEAKRQQKKADKRAELENSFSYSLVKGIKVLFDDFFLDPILGFFAPGVGDWLTAPLVLPYIYMSLFKIHSIPLTLAIIYNWLIDAVLGSIPIIGDIIDAFYKGYGKSYSMIVGYVEDDKEIIDEVNSKAVKTFILIVIFGLILYYLVSWIVSLTQWVWNLISSLF